MFDLAIAGEVISACSCRTAAGIYPDGSFRLDNERRLVSPQGYRLVSCPAGEDFELVIGSKGQITVHTVSGDTIDN